MVVDGGLLFYGADVLLDWVCNSEYYTAFFRNQREQHLGSRGKGALRPQPLTHLWAARPFSGTYNMMLISYIMIIHIEMMLDYLRAPEESGS